MFIKAELTRDHCFNINFFKIKLQWWKDTGNNPFFFSRKGLAVDVLSPQKKTKDGANLFVDIGKIVLIWFVYTFCLILTLLLLLSEKYDYVGRLLKPGDEPSEYTDEEDIKDHLKHD